MNNGKALLIRSCPVCRVAMLRTDSGWSCPQCGSAIVDAPVKVEFEPDPKADEPLNATA
jgi:uncharacterized Zn finger protein (UPF0148 family)